MDLIRFGNGLAADPFREFETLQEEINRLFDVSRVPETRGIFERSFSPAVDVVELPDRFEVFCDVPGIEMGDIEVSLAGAVLTVKGEKKAPAGGPGRAYREEGVAGRFQRTIQLPGSLDPEKVEASLKDGVLTIALPKHEAARPHQVTVKAR